MREESNIVKTLKKEEKRKGIVFQDITDGIKADEQLKISEERYTNLIELAPDSVVTIDLKGYITSCNSATARIFRYSKDDLVGKHFSKIGILHVKDIPNYLKVFVSVLQGNGTGVYELTVNDKDGASRIVEAHIDLIKENNKISGILAITRDITERKRAEEALREGEEKWLSLVSILPDYISLLDGEGRFLFLNHYAEGFTEKDVIGSSVYQYLSTESKEIFSKKIAECQNTGKIQKFEHIAMGEHGIMRKYEDYLIPILEKNKVTSTMVVARDITERKNAEEEIRYLKDYNENILESNPNPILVVKGTQIEYVNKSFVSIFGETKNEYITKNLKDVVPSEILPIFENLLQEAGISKELKFREKEFIVHSFVIKKAEEEEEEEETRRGMVFQDITERKQAEETLAQQNEALSQLNHFSIELSMLSPEDNLEAFIGKQIKEITGAEVAIFSHYTPANRTITLQHIEMDPGLLEKVVSLLDKQVTKIHSIVSDEMYREMTTEIIGGRRTLHEASFGAISRPVAAAIQTLLKVDRFIGLAYVIEGELYGTSLLAMKKGQPDPPKQILENFIFLATVSLRRKRAEASLKESEGKYRVLIQNSKDSIVVIDLEGNVKFANESTEKLTGYSYSEGVGMNVKKITPLKNWPKSLEALQKAKKGKAIPYFESEIKRKDGEIVQVETGGQPILKDGKVVGVQIITRDITERKKTENELKNNEKKLRKIIDSSPDGIMLTDLQGNIVECNQLALEMYGTSVKKDLTDRNSFDLIAPEYRERAMENLKKTLKSGVVKNLEYVLLKKDGSKYPAELSASTVNDQNGNPKYLLAIIRDISERKRAEEALEKYRREIEQQNIQLKKADQLKTDFLNVTSHELRTPMSAIKGYVQIILKQALGQISDEQKKALDVVLRNTNRLDALIQDILDISRLESGTMKFIVGNIEIREMLDEIVETMQPYANQKEIKINTQIENNLPELTADKERIKQVIINIVHNAVKFSSTDSIINIRTRKEQDNILFEIQDFGKGIPQDQQEKVFEMFYQVDSGADRKFGGVGLGLAISRGIVVSSGGKIWVESTVGEGSTFKFTLPLKPVKDVENRFKEMMDLFELERKRR